MTHNISITRQDAEVLTATYEDMRVYVESRIAAIDHALKHGTIGPSVKLQSKKRRTLSAKARKAISTAPEETLGEGREEAEGDGGGSVEQAAMTPDEKYQRAIEQGDPATAVIPWANRGKPIAGYVNGGYFYFKNDGQVTWVEESSVERSLKRMAY